MALARAALLFAVLGAWELLPRSGLMNPELLPPLSEVLDTLWKLLHRAKVHDAIGVTMAEVVVAFVVAIPLGTLLGVLIAEKPYLADIFTLPASLAGLPGMSLPAGFGEGGMPVGLQLIGNYFQEGALLHAAHAFQQATDWHRRVPQGF